jgi:ATP/ADP translocase
MGFYLYKGLKKPLVFFGLKGKYIFYAVGVIGIGVIAALVLSKFGLLGSLLGLAVTAGGVYLTFKRQDKYGLYDKTKNFDQILIFPKKLTNKRLLKNDETERFHMTNQNK